MIITPREVYECRDETLWDVFCRMVGLHYQYEDIDNFKDLYDMLDEEYELDKDQMHELIDYGFRQRRR